MEAAKTNLIAYLRTIHLISNEPKNDLERHFVHMYERNRLFADKKEQNEGYCVIPDTVRLGAHVGENNGPMWLSGKNGVPVRWPSTTVFTSIKTGGGPPTSLRMVSLGPR